MESVFLSSVSLGILVEKEIVVRIEDKTNGDSTPSHPSSVVSAVRSISNLAREKKKPELSETISSLPSGKMLARPNVSEDCRKDLVEFFHGRPPKGNFMSIPDDVSISSVDGKWGVLKVFRKKRKRRKRRQPPLIRLPDSAVSARTIDGHRYIAISIPINYSNYSPVPFQRPLAKHKSTSDPPRNVLKTVTEDHESLSTLSLPTKSTTQQDGFTELAPPPKEVSLLSAIPSQASQEEISSNKGKELGTLEIGTARQALMTPLISNKHSYFTDQESKSPNRQRALQIDQPKKASISTQLEADKFPRLIDVTLKKVKSTQANKPSASENLAVSRNDSKGASKSSGTSRSLLAKSSNAPTLPTRTSSKRAVTFAGQNDVYHRPMLSTANSDNDDGNGHTTGPCASVADSLQTTESSPRLLKAQTATAYQSVPIVVRPPGHPEAESPLNLNFPTPPSGNSLRGNSEEQLAISSPPEVAKAVSARKERVRERKQKDIEKLKTQLRQGKAPASGIPAGNDWPESPVLGRFGNNVGLSSSKSYLTSKMAEIGPTKQGLQLKSPYMSPKAVIKKRRGRSSSVPLMAGSSSPSPSFPDSPMPLEGSTAYYRRRERQAERDENEARTRREKYAAQALVEEAELRDQIARHKLIRRYEKLKEIRTKDMEKRLHRLERNGELLMQSMVSLMDTLNKILQDQHQTPLRRSVTARTAPTSASRSHRRKHHENIPQRAQSLRSIRSYDNLREIIRSSRVPKQNSPDPDSAKREGDTKGKGREDADTRVSASALEALQEQLQSHSRQIAGMSGQASDSSSDKSIEVDSAEAMREIREAARKPEGERGRTAFTDTEMFNLF
ncbi:hypothetical protein F5Y02DRAFT_372598 [Annulohypoxylon stygium]|nr:hypothetical protein F5Y02DRAFT_372598 [Annulohypoxylon stygium]